MFVFYQTNSGDIAFTINGESYPEHLVTGAIGVIRVETPPKSLDGWKVSDDQLLQVSIEPVKSACLASLRQQIAAHRAAHLTDLPGQDVIYLRKEREAVAYLAEANPTLADYPLLSAEVGVTAATAYQVAQIWLHKSQSWQQTAAALEAIRLRGVNAIAAATTEAEAVQALHAFDAALTAASGPTPI